MGCVEFNIAFMKKLATCLFLCLFSFGLQAHPVKELIERIDKGASSGFVIEEVASDTDFFELLSRNPYPYLADGNSADVVRDVYDKLF